MLVYYLFNIIKGITYEKEKREIARNVEKTQKYQYNLL